MISWCEYLVSVQVKFGPSQKKYSMKRLLNHFHICSYKASFPKRLQHLAAVRDGPYIPALKLWVKGSSSSMQVSHWFVAQTCQNASSPSVYTLLSCLKRFQRWAGSDMSSSFYSLSQEGLSIVDGGGVVNSFGWSRWNLVRFCLHAATEKRQQRIISLLFSPIISISSSIFADWVKCWPSMGFTNTGVIRKLSSAG